MKLHVFSFAVVAVTFSLFPHARAEASSEVIGAIRSVEITPPEGKAYVYLYRNVDGNPDFNMTVDGIKFGILQEKTFVVFDLPAGSHVIAAISSSTQIGSNSLLGSSKKIKLEPGQILFLQNATNTDPTSWAGRGCVSEFFLRDMDRWQGVKERLKFAGVFGFSDDEEGRKVLSSYDLQQDSLIRTVSVTTDAGVKINLRPRVGSGKVGSVDVPVSHDGVAVIVGSRYYSKINKDLPDVDFAHNDADAVYQYVTGKLGYREENVILLKDATQSQLLSVFGSSNRPQGKLYKWVKPNKSDVFVYYSGHGVPGASDGRSYLLPVDADPATVEINGLPLETLYSNLNQLPSKSLTVVLDACFSGSSSGGSVFQSASSITLRTVDTSSLVPKGTVLTATGQNQVASWDKKARLGLFTRAFLEGVGGVADGDGYGNGDGTVTLGELSAYLREEVTYNARRTYGREQEPQIFGEPGQVLNSMVKH